MEEQNSDVLSIEGIYSKLKKFMLKHFIIDLGTYPNLIKFLTEDSICLDEETIESIEQDFREKIYEILEELGSVFVKLNHSAATDSDFLVHKLECFKLEEILVLLKGSDKLSRIFENFQNKNSEGLFLILKKFYDIKQENEFRLFILDKEVRGISQKHLNIYFNYDNVFIDEVKKNILDFYDKELRPILDSFPNFLFVDVLFLEKSKKIKIVDIISEDVRINLYGIGDENSQSSEKDDYFLLFKNWEEIREITDFNCEKSLSDLLRVIKSNNEIIETKENFNKFPLEIIGEENNHNINEIINLLCINEKEYLEK